MDLEEIKEEKENRPPEIRYHEFQKTLEESDHPMYSLIKDGPLSREEFDRLKGARNQEEYQRIWDRLQETRREEREEEYRQKRREDSQVQWQRR